MVLRAGCSQRLYDRAVLAPQLWLRLRRWSRRSLRRNMERRGHSEREDRGTTCSRSFVASPNVEPHSLMRRWLLEFRYLGGRGTTALLLLHWKTRCVTIRSTKDMLLVLNLEVRNPYKVKIDTFYQSTTSLDLMTTRVLCYGVCGTPRCFAMILLGSTSRSQCMLYPLPFLYDG
jgi:hypothetical protein